MSDKFLEGARAKVERSETQVHDLELKIRTFLKLCPHRIISKVNTDRDEEVWSFHLESRIPAEIPVIIGEILHNLRSALDQIACAVARQHSGSTKGTYFPFGATAEAFETQALEKCKKLPATAVDMIRALKPYKGGNDLLWTLHHLNRNDKHIDVVPINLRTRSSGASYLIVHSGQVLTLGSRAGQHLNVVRASQEEINSTAGPTGVYQSPPGTYIEFGSVGCSADESREFLTTTPGAKFDTDMKPTFDIALRDIKGGIEHQSVIAALHQLRNVTQRILLEFERRFF